MRYVVLNLKPPGQYLPWAEVCSSAGCVFVSRGADAHTYAHACTNACSYIDRSRLIHLGEHNLLEIWSDDP